MTLSGLRSLDKSAIVGLLFVVSGQRDPQGRKLLVGFEPTKAFLCFVHGRSGPAQRDLTAEGIMAGGHMNRVKRPDTWLLRPTLQNVKKVLANPEPSTH